MAAEPQNRLEFLDGLRACAALFVLMHHCVIHVAPPNLFVGGFFTAIFAEGHLAVDLFIVLSGYCLVLPTVRNQLAMRESVGRFYFRRAWRILPPYFAALLLSLALIALALGEKTGTHWNVSLPVTSKALWTHLFLIHDAFHDTFAKINHVFWSISVEFRIYFLFPLFVWIWRRFGLNAFLAASFILSFALVRALRKTDLLSEMCGISPQYVFLFAMGMAAAGIAHLDTPFNKTLRRFARPSLWLIGSALLVLALKLAARAKGQIAPVYLSDYCIGFICATGLIVLSTSHAGALGRIFSWKPLVAVGLFAYSIYLMHAPLIQLLWLYVFKNLPINADLQILLLWLAAPPLIVAACYLFFLVAERPFLRAPKALFSKTPDTPPDRPDPACSSPAANQRA